MIESRILPEGAFQLLCGSAGDLLDHLDCQDAVAFTGSASTGADAQAAQAVDPRAQRPLQPGSRLAQLLDARARRDPGTEEFDLFIKEVAKEMTVKAGQKCTAIRRTFVPEAMVRRRRCRRSTSGSTGVKVGDPSVEGVRMGPLAGRGAGDARCGRASSAIAQATELRVRRPRRLRRRRRRSGEGRVLPDAALLRGRSVRAHRAARRRGVRAREHRHAVHSRWTKRSSSRSWGREASSARSSPPTTRSRARWRSARRRITGA